jgi:endo-1,4-beta-xylanase
MNGHIEFTAIRGPVTRKEISFGLYLPGEYHQTPGRKFPVMYYLHGLNEDYTANIEIVAGYMEKAVEQGMADPMIIVTPDGYNNSMWMDSIDGKKPSETNLIKELIPYIERTYRVIPDRENRIIAGFSMGGYGAIRYAMKLPEYFGRCISMDGAIHTLKTFKQFRSDIFCENFHENSAYFNANNVYELAEKNVDKVRGRVDFFILVGVLTTFNDRFCDHMKALNMPIADGCFIKTGCDHDVQCMLEKEGVRLLRWMASPF